MFREYGNSYSPIDSGLTDFLGLLRFSSHTPFAQSALVGLLLGVNHGKRQDGVIKAVGAVAQLLGPFERRLQFKEIGLDTGE